MANIMIKHKGERVFIVKPTEANKGRVVPGWNEVSPKLAERLLKKFPKEFEVAPKVAPVPAPAVVEAPAAVDVPEVNEVPKKEEKTSKSKKKDA